MKKYLCLILFFILFIRPSFSQTARNSVGIKSCKVKFNYKKSVVDTKSLNKCIEQFDLKKLLYIDIFTTSSPEGGLAYNYLLSNRRAKNIAKSLDRFKVPVKIKNGGSSYIYGRQGTITFLFQDFNEPVLAAEPVKIVQKCDDQPKTSESQIGRNDFSFGIGMTFLPSPLSDYSGAAIMTYNVQAIHRVKPFTLWSGRGDFYIGGQVSLGTNKKSMGATTVSGVSISAVDIRYVRNDYGFIFGAERNFQSADSLALYFELEPAFQERVLVIAQTNGIAQNGYASRVFGILANLGVKYKLLNNNEKLKKVGIDNLIVKLAVNASYGTSMTTDYVKNTGTAQIIDLNGFSWGPVLNLGFSF